MMVTDASVWISSFHRDRYHQTTLTWLKGIATTGDILTAPNLLLPEVAGALARRTGRSRVGRWALEQLSKYRFLHIYPVDDQLALIAAELAADYQLRGADAVYAALAYTLDVPLVTWDAEQMNRVQKVIRAGTPGTI